MTDLNSGGAVSAKRRGFRVSDDGWVRGAECPECGRRTIGLVLRGMPAGPPPRGYIMGGCVWDGPSYGCHECDWLGEESELVRGAPLRGVGPLDVEAIRRFEPYINAATEGVPGVARSPWFDGEARDHYEVARRHGRIRYTLLSRDRIVAWFDDLLGWVLPVARGSVPDRELLAGLGPNRVIPAADGADLRAAGRDRVMLITAYRVLGPERELFATTAVGDGGVRFWFIHDYPGAGVMLAEQAFRRVVLDSVQLAGVEGRPENLGQVVVDQLRVAPVPRFDLEVEWEAFKSWPEAEDRARALAAVVADRRR